MENEEDFFHIGAEFTENTIKDRRFENQDILEEQSKKLGDMRDDYEENHTVIRVEPNPNIPIPDTTGNGVMAYEDFSVESAILESEENKELDKLNFCMYKQCLTILKETDQTLVKTYEKHRFDVNKRKFVDVLYRKALQSNYSYVNCRYTYKKYFNLDNFTVMFDNIRKALEIIKFDHEDTYLKAIKMLGSDRIRKLCDDLNCDNLNNLIINNKKNEAYELLENIVSFEMKHNISPMELSLSSEIAKKNKWKETKMFIGEVIDDTMYVDLFIKFQEDMVKSYQNHKLYMKKYLPDITKVSLIENAENSKGLYCVLNFLYYYTIAVCKIATDLNWDFQNIMILIEPTESKLKTNRLIDVVEATDAWISSDYHLLAELLKGTGKGINRSKEIIRMHNKYVKPNDIFLFLGDISEQEFYDETNEKNAKIMEILTSLCNTLNGKKIMITGNNDTAPDSFYKKLGFVEVIREPVLLGRHVFSHEPIETDEGVLNVHGHIHGSKAYWNMDYSDHIDAYYGIYGHPVRLSYLDEYYSSGKYKGCKTVIHDEED